MCGGAVRRSFHDVPARTTLKGSPLTPERHVNFRIELEQETDGRWIAEVPDLPGVLAYGTSREDALARVQALALRVLAERLEHGEADVEAFSVSFLAA
jgi:predicted RNase H-like HicB family nuclease